MDYSNVTAMSKARKATSLAFLVLLAITTTNEAFTNASIAYPPSPEQMFTNSDLVVTCTVLEVNTRWGQGNESIIITVVRLGVEGIAKGEQYSPIIEVNIPGGKMEELGVWMEDQPTFTVGEHVLLYLKSGLTPQDGAPRYTLTGGTLFGKSYAAGNTTIGAVGERVPIVTVATALWDITITDNNEKMPATEIISHGPWELVQLDIPEVIYTQGDNVQVEVSVIAQSTINLIKPLGVTGGYDVPLTSENFYFSVNGNTTVAFVPVLVKPGESKVFKATLELPGTREVMLNPFASPSNHVDYTIGVGSLQRKVTVYAYPDYTYLYAGLGALIVFTSAVFIVRRRRTSSPHRVPDSN
jgi:hypothetical protein